MTNNCRRNSTQRCAIRSPNFPRRLGRKGEIDPRLMRLAGQIAGVSNLKFERNSDAGGREMQPVMDSERPHRRVLHLGQDCAGDASVEASGAACFHCRCSFWPDLPAWRCGSCGVRATNSRRGKCGGRAADEDKLTGLPNHAKMLELLDLALAERAATR